MPKRPLEEKTQLKPKLKTRTSTLLLVLTFFRPLLLHRPRKNKRNRLRPRRPPQRNLLNQRRAKKKLRHLQSPSLWLRNAAREPTARSQLLLQPRSQLLRALRRRGKARMSRKVALRSPRRKRARRARLLNQSRNRSWSRSLKRPRRQRRRSARGRTRAKLRVLMSSQGLRSSCEAEHLEMMRFHVSFLRQLPLGLLLLLVLRSHSVLFDQRQESVGVYKRYTFGDYCGCEGSQGTHQLAIC